MDSLGIMRDSFFDDLKNNSVRINSYFNKKFSSKLNLRTGIGLNFLDYNYYTRVYQQDTEEWDTYLDSEGGTELYQAYAQVKYKFTDRFVFSSGLHYSHFMLNQDNSIEPRVGISYELPNEQKIGLGYGKHTRHEQLPVYFVENKPEDGIIYMPNVDLKLTRSHHFMLSYEKPVFENAFFKAEVYYQHIPNLPVSANPEKNWSPIFGGVNPDDTLANIGKGKNYGIELTLHKQFSKGYYFILTSSLFNSQYKAADGIWRSTMYNIKYVNNMVGGKEIKWGDNKMISLNGRLIWTGGKRITPVDLEASIEKGEAVYDTEFLYAEQAKDYFRLDLGLKLHFYKKKTEQIISLDIQNVTNRLNTWYEIYDDVNEQVIDYPMAGLIPVLSYRIEF
jgi:outer membrane receptor protein involved in Fe transport